MGSGETYFPLALALGLGLLVGMQRQWKSSEIAGIRSFPLITLLGVLAAMADFSTGGVIIAAGFVAVASLLSLANVAKLKAGSFDPGITTEAAVLVMYGVGAALGRGYFGPAIVTTGVTAVLLHWKQPLHSLVERLGEQDFRAIINLTLIALVILPVLPDKTFGPYQVLNPYKIWLMVVLIVGISMAAYVACKAMGASVGAVLGGIFGGLISSTATTVSYSRQTRQGAIGEGTAAVVILIASAIVYPRVLFEIGAVSRPLLREAAGPLGAMFGVMTLLSAGLVLALRRQEVEPPSNDPPAQLKPAIVFGGLYALVLLVVAAVQDRFGSEALNLVAAISGLTDVDAITLSAARLFSNDRLEASAAWRVTLIATLSNLVFKAGAVAMWGNRRLLKYIATLFGLSFLAGVAILWAWPG
ncbi:MAG: MgtC/SapB family protein [Planctomycetales bacterium]|nr:MgtC/SapB family protein [Planctomycetales bacterium]